MGFPYASDKLGQMIDSFELMCVMRPDTLLYFTYRSLLWYQKRLIELDDRASGFLFPEKKKVGKVDFGTRTHLSEIVRPRLDARKALRLYETVRMVPENLNSYKTVPMQRDAFKSLLDRLQFRGESSDDPLMELAAIQVLEQKDITDPLQFRFEAQEVTPLTYAQKTVESYAMPFSVQVFDTLEGSVDGETFSGEVSAEEPAVLVTRSAEARITLEVLSLGDSFTVTVNGNPYTSVAPSAGSEEEVLQDLREKIADGAESGVLSELDVFNQVLTLVISGEDFSCTSSSVGGAISQIDGFDFSEEAPTSTSYDINGNWYSLTAIASIGSVQLETTTGVGTKVSKSGVPVGDPMRDAYPGCITRLQDLSGNKLWLRVLSVYINGDYVEYDVTPWVFDDIAYPSPWPNDPFWTDNPAFLYHDNRIAVSRDGEVSVYEYHVAPDVAGSTYAEYIVNLIDGAVLFPTDDDVQVSSSEELIVVGSGMSPGLGFYPAQDQKESPGPALDIRELSGTSSYSFVGEAFMTVAEVMTKLSLGAVNFVVAQNGNKIDLIHTTPGPFFLEVTTSNESLGLTAQIDWGTYSELTPVSDNEVLRFVQRRSNYGKVSMDSSGVFTFTDTTATPVDGEVMYVAGVGYRKYEAAGPSLDFPIPEDRTYRIFFANDTWQLTGGLIDVSDGVADIGLPEGEYAGGILTAQPAPELEDVYYDGVVLHRYLDTGWEPPLTDRVVFVDEPVVDGARYVVTVNGNDYSYVASVPTDDVTYALQQLRNAIEAGAEPVMTVSVEQFDGVLGLHLVSPAYTVAVSSVGGVIRVAPVFSATHYVNYLLSVADLEEKPYGRIIRSALNGQRVSSLPDISWWREWDPQEIDFVDTAGLSFVEALQDSRYSTILQKFRTTLTYSGYLDLRSGALSDSINVRSLIKNRFEGSQADNIPINQSTFIPDETNPELPERVGEFDGDFDEVY